MFTLYFVSLVLVPREVKEGGLGGADYPCRGSPPLF